MQSTSAAGHVQQCTFLIYSSKKIHKQRNNYIPILKQPNKTQRIQALLFCVVINLKSVNECCTCRHHRLYSCAVDEGSLDGLSPNIRPIDALLQSVVIHNRDVVDVRDSEGDYVVVVWIIDVHSSYLNLTGVQQELTRLWKRHRDTRHDWGQRRDQSTRT